MVRTQRKPHYREDIEEMAKEAEKKAIEPDEDIGNDRTGAAWRAPDARRRLARAA